MEQELSRRGLPVYRKNPSVKEAIVSMKTGVKRISSNNSGNEMLIASKSTGEIVTSVDIGFHQRVKVDKTQFVKLYIQGVSAFVGLSKAGGRSLEMVIAESNANIGKDMLFLAPKIAKEIYGIPKPTLMRGMRELIEKGVLFESVYDNMYFINVNFMFNGDRLAFLKTYELKKDDDIEENINQPSLPFES